MTEHTRQRILYSILAVLVPFLIAVVLVLWLNISYAGYMWFVVSVVLLVLIWRRKNTRQGEYK